MDVLAKFIIKFRRWIVAVFVILALISLVLLPLVKVNYNMADYLPENAQSTKALSIMEAEFDESIPNASVLIKDVSLTKALDYKDKLKAIEGVEQVLWLDDIIDPHIPLETLDEDLIKGYYKDSNALFTVTVDPFFDSSAVDSMRELIGDKGAVSGQLANSADIKKTMNSEVALAISIALPAVIIILILTTTSWLEPLLFLIAIGISVLINMGTNALFGEVSFVTFSVSPILQLAVSLDYAIFMLHSFFAFRDKYGNEETAMRHAIRSSASTITASAATTLFGFIALTFMKFEIGMDLGLNLAKGIVFSFLSCIIFLPALTLSVYKLIDKTRHRPFLPKLKGNVKVLSKLILPITLVVILIIVPSYLGQKKTEFIYGNANTDPNSINELNRTMVTEAFGQSSPMVMLVPTKDIATEAALSKELKSHPQVESLVSFTEAVGTVIPKDILPSEIKDQFYSKNYTRIIANLATPDEGELAFKTVEEINDLAKAHYGEGVYTLGQSPSLYDMKSTVEKDNSFVNIIAIVAILTVLLLTFRSLSLPFILLFAIEAGIIINLAIPYFTNTPINFLGYLVVKTVQLGATIDYAILLTTTYLINRSTMTQSKAMRTALHTSFLSIMVSASTLSIAGFALAGTTSTAAVADIGLLLARGTILSVIMVLALLPAMLKIFDRLIAKTTYGINFFTEKK